MFKIDKSIDDRLDYLMAFLASLYRYFAGNNCFFARHFCPFILPDWN
jgi:hypothetical protein